MSISRSVRQFFKARLVILAVLSAPVMSLLPVAAAHAEAALPQNASLYTRYLFNSSTSSSVGGLKYDVYDLDGNSLNVAGRAYSTYGNTKGFGTSVANPTGKWLANWEPAARDRFDTGGSACVWFKSNDGVNNAPITKTRGERFLRIRSDSDINATHYVVLNLYVNKVTGNTYSISTDWDGSTSNTIELNSGVPINAAWHYHCVTVTSTGALTYYIDGVSRVTATVDAQHNPFQNGFYVTDYTGGAAGSRFTTPNGYIDDFATWKTVLTGAEVMQAYTAPTL